ncbi:L-threonine 3-dehydrogenase, mitochondrial [Zancudomyces culisetae]|uniref:L-threonine 3-dehydrogenase, mitochondrial n=1 Tax=Zancudomyces culisetae TaxID=1213189 RepID=A0A1R1PR63_ZANCU|nr:L-threonine 3-dehydrogenase, mitochondrial [Zancudomyces culisetae]|eukprot:OMH83429.1 L-threonine 3-dehydrogenase, mitochondrial [Zancudomyces culisetae]
MASLTVKGTRDLLRAVSYRGVYTNGVFSFPQTQQLRGNTARRSEKRYFSNSRTVNSADLDITNNEKPKVLVTGCLGQLGMALIKKMREKYGVENVIGSDIKVPTDEVLSDGPFVPLNVLDKEAIENEIVRNKVDVVVHLSAILSALGEKKPDIALRVNVSGFQNVLELARKYNLKLFCPSTMGAFGPSTPRVNTPDLTVMRPTTIYGITKVHMELMGEYYNEKYGLDFRSLRYPGIISADSAPGGGTTDYAVDIFHSALKSNSFVSFLNKDTSLPMMYLDDCIDGTMQFIEAPNKSLKQRVYNIHALTFSPQELAEGIQEQWSKDFKIHYNPDYRQAIADTWPISLDDSIARRDWKFDPKINTVASLVKIMFEKLQAQRIASLDEPHRVYGSQ